MATARTTPKVRSPRKPRSRSDADVAAIAAEITAQYLKTLDYLGR